MTAEDSIITGSSDGKLRVVAVHSKSLGAQQGWVRLRLLLRVRWQVLGDLHRFRFIWVLKGSDQKAMGQSPSFPARSLKTRISIEDTLFRPRVMKSSSESSDHHNSSFEPRNVDQQCNKRLERTTDSLPSSLVPSFHCLTPVDPGEAFTARFWESLVSPNAQRKMEGLFMSFGHLYVTFLRL